MDAEMIDLLLTVTAAWTVFAIAGVGIIVLPWTASETSASAGALRTLLERANPAVVPVEDCLSRRIVVG